jgi:energy-coupling factor transport system ATP-binding protein
VAIAATLAMQPSVLVLDEPTADLDPVGTQELMGVVRQLNEEHGMTVILIEHKIDEVVGWVDRVILMEDGQIVLDADPHQAFGDESDWVRLRVAVPQMVQLSHALPTFFSRQTALTVNEALAVLGDEPQVVDAVQQEGLAAANGGAVHGSPILQWDHVSLSYGDKGVLNDVSLEVYPEEWVALVGSNGSGKTSLAGMAMGFDATWAGTVRFDGRPVQRGRITAQAGRLGYLFQSPDMMLFSDTVEHELKFTELYGARDPLREVRSIDELAGFADLRERLQNNPFQLSYGQRQRLAIASLLATHPKALILDEPTTGQDEGHAQVVLDFLRRLQQTYGVALLMISHDMRAVALYANRVAVLSPAGRLVMQGPPAEVFAQTEVLAQCHVTAPPAADLHNRLARQPLKRVALSTHELLGLLRRNRVISGAGTKGGLGHV